MTLRYYAVSVVAALLAGCATVPRQTSGLSTLGKVGDVDERYLSYNVEMVEITGGNFWRPYGSPGTDTKEYRKPIDLADPRLRRYAAALAPAYIRISGTWANATWFSDGEAAPDKAPAGFDSVLTRKQWRDAVEFAKASDGRIVTSFATSPGTRDGKGVWQSDNAARWLAYTHRIGGTIAATEFANEPNMMWLTQPPAGYGAPDYRRDYARFAAWLHNASPRTLLIAPGVAELGEPVRTRSRASKNRPVYETEDLLGPGSPRPAGFSFHYYGGASERCGGRIFGHTLAKSVTPEWLDSIDVAIARVAKSRDRLMPGAPLWITEAGESSCGGNPWASTFADSFRFVDTLGRAARQGVRVFMHNTLAASDYALLDEHNYTPRPNYWAAVLWKRTMGTTVLASPMQQTAELRTYAHCLPDRNGGVGLAAINVGDAAQTMPIGDGARSWTIRATTLDSKEITIDGVPPSISDDGKFSGRAGVPASGSVSVPGKGIVFVAIPDARNPACR